MEDFETIFTKHDNKNTLTMSKDQFENFISDFCKKTQNKELTTDEINSGWKIIQKNGDGEVTKNDLLTYCEFFNKDKILKKDEILKNQEILENEKNIVILQKDGVLGNCDFEKIFSKFDKFASETMCKDQFEGFITEFCKLTQNKDISANEINDGWKIILKNGDGEVTKNDLRTYCEFLVKDKEFVVDVMEI